MKFWTSEHTFSHPWETVTKAAWRKYPNPMNPNVVGLDVIDRQVEKGVLKSHRLMTTEWGLPDWVIKIVGFNKVCYVSEHSEVDPQKKTMTLNSRNLTLCNYITVDEKLQYRQHPSDKSSTLLKQECTINVKGIPLSDYLEGMVISSCSSNANKGRQAMEWVIEKIKTEAEDLGRAAFSQASHFSQSLKKETGELSRAAKQQADHISQAMPSPSATNL